MWWSTKRRCALHLYSLYNYWFCYENRKKNYPQVYLEEYKYKMKKKKMAKFIDVGLKSDSSFDSEWFTMILRWRSLILYVFMYYKTFISVKTSVHLFSDKHSILEKICVTYRELCHASSPHSPALAIFHTLVIRYSTSVTCRVLCHASGHQMIYC